MSLFRSHIASFLHAELAGVDWLPRAVPDLIAARRSAWLGLGGAGIMASGFLACHISYWMLALVTLGLLVSWLGGAATPDRANVRPKRGFFVDHSADLIAQTLVILGLGLSPYFTLCSALLALSILLLISSYSYLRSMVMATEPLFSGRQIVFKVCLLAASWGFLAAGVGPGVAQLRIFDRAVLDVCVGAVWLLIFIVFIVKVRRDLVQIDEDFSQGG